MATATDKKVLELFEKVKEKRNTIKKAEKPKWVTNCVFSYDIDKKTKINLQVESDISVFILMLAFLLEKERAFKEAAKELQVEGEFKWLGFSVDEWKNDFKQRVNKLDILKRKKELEDLEERLNKIVSPELRAELEVKLIEEALEK